MPIVINSTAMPPNIIDTRMVITVESININFSAIVRRIFSKLRVKYAFKPVFDTRRTLVFSVCH